MIPTLPDSVDVSKLTRTEACAWISSMAQRVALEENTDLITAWRKVKGAYPALAAKAAESGPSAESCVKPVSVDTTALWKGAPASPYAGQAGKPQSLGDRLFPKLPISLPNESNIAALGLPADCSWEEFRAADAANAGASPRNSRAIFNALVKLLAARGVSPDTANAVAEQRYPELAQELAGAEEANPA